MARLVERPRPPPRPAYPPPWPPVRDDSQSASSSPLLGEVERIATSLVQKVAPHIDQDGSTRDIAAVAVIAGIALAGTLCILCLLIGLMAWLFRRKRQGYSKPTDGAGRVRGESLHCVTDLDAASEESFEDGTLTAASASVAARSGGAATLGRVRPADDPLARLSDELSALSKIHELNDHPALRVERNDDCRTEISPLPLEAYPDMSRYAVEELADEDGQAEPLALTASLAVYALAPASLPERKPESLISGMD